MSVSDIKAQGPPSHVWILLGWCTTQDAFVKTLRSPLKISDTASECGDCLSLNLETSKTSSSLSNEQDPALLFRQPFSFFLKTLIEELCSTQPKIAVYYCPSMHPASPDVGVSWIVFLRIRSEVISVENLTLSLSSRLCFLINHLQSVSAITEEFRNTKKTLDARLSLLCYPRINTSPPFSFQASSFCGVIDCYDHIDYPARSSMPQGVHTVLSMVEKTMWENCNPYTLPQLFLSSFEKQLQNQITQPSSSSTVTHAARAPSLCLIGLPVYLLEEIFCFIGCNKTIQVLGCTCSKLFCVASSFLVSTGNQSSLRLYPHQKHSLLWLQQRERRRCNGFPVSQCFVPSLPSPLNRITTDDLEETGIVGDDNFCFMNLCEAHDPLKVFSFWKELRLPHPSAFYKSTNATSHETADFLTLEIFPFTYKILIVGIQQYLTGVTVHPSNVPGFIFIPSLIRSSSCKTLSGVSLFFNNLDSTALIGISSQKAGESAREYTPKDCGGIFCDEPGLGKTVTILGLTMKHFAGARYPTTCLSPLNNSSQHCIPVSLLFAFTSALNLPMFLRCTAVSSFKVYLHLPVEFRKRTAQAKSSPDSTHLKRATGLNAIESAQQAALYQPLVCFPSGVLDMKRKVSSGEVLTEAAFLQETGDDIMRDTPDGQCDNKNERRLRAMLRQLGSDAGWHCFTETQQRLECQASTVRKRRLVSLDRARAWSIANENDVSSSAQPRFTETEYDQSDAVAGGWVDSSATMIIVPDYLLSHWESEIRKWFTTELSSANTDNSGVLILKSHSVLSSVSRFRFAAAKLVLAPQTLFVFEERLVALPKFFVRNVLPYAEKLLEHPNLAKLLSTEAKTSFLTSTLLDTAKFFKQLETFFSGLCSSSDSAKLSKRCNVRAAELVFFAVLQELLKRSCHSSTQAPVTYASLILRVRQLAAHFSQRSPFLSVIWQRVIVDEGHQLGTTSAAYRFICSLMLARARWVISGTPFSRVSQTAKSQIQKLFEFLHHPIVNRSPLLYNNFFSRYFKFSESTEHKDVKNASECSQVVAKNAPASPSCETAKNFVRLGAMTHDLVLYSTLLQTVVIHSKNRIAQLPSVRGPYMRKLLPVLAERDAYNDLVELVQKNLFLTYFSRRNRASFLNPCNKKSAQEMVANLNLAWLFPPVGLWFMSQESIDLTCAMLLRCTATTCYAGCYNHYYCPVDFKRLAFVKRVFRDIGNLTYRSVVLCDVCNQCSRFPILIPCPALHLVCAQCLIKNSHFTAAGLRCPLTACILCNATIHADFFDRLQPPTETQTDITDSQSLFHLAADAETEANIASSTLSQSLYANSVLASNRSEARTVVSRFVDSTDGILSVEEAERNAITKNLSDTPTPQHFPPFSKYNTTPSDLNPFASERPQRPESGCYDSSVSVSNTDAILQSGELDDEARYYARLLRRSSKLLYLVQRLRYLTRSGTFSTPCDVQDQSVSTSEFSPQKIIVVSRFWEQLFFLGKALQHIFHIFASHLYPMAGTERRLVAIDEFRMRPDRQILLLHPSLGSHGLDLNFASYVILMEPINDLNLKDQIISRAHRVGATRPVYVEELVLTGTLEDSTSLSPNPFRTSSVPGGSKWLHRDRQTLSQSVSSRRREMTRRGRHSRRPIVISAGQGGQSHTQPKKDNSLETAQCSTFDETNFSDEPPSTADQANLEKVLKSLQRLPAPSGPANIV